MSFYSDLNHQDPLNDTKIFDLESIYQSLDNIIHTQPKERLFLPDFGCDLMQYLFSPMTALNSFNIKNTVAGAVEKWEPRVSVNRSLSKVITSPDTHEVTLEVVFAIKGKTETEYVYQTNLEKNSEGQYYAV